MMTEQQYLGQDRTILIVTHVIPYPPAAGNEIRIMSMINWLKSAGFRIVLLLKHYDLPAETITLLEEKIGVVHTLAGRGASEGRKSLVGSAAKAVRRFFRMLDLLNHGMSWDYCRRSLEIKEGLCPQELVDMTRELVLRYRPAAVIAEYVFMAPCLARLPAGVLRIIDTHDIFSRKKEQVLAYGVDDPLFCSGGEERGYLLQSDVVMAIQSHEASMFRRLVPERKVISVGIDFCPVSGCDNFVASETVLIVGSDNPLNLLGLKQFISEAWPKIRKECPGAVFRVIGKIGAAVTAADDSVQKVGWVESLDEEYSRAAVVVNPVMAGTGLKIKSVEALCRGRALVATPNSVEGIEYEHEPPYIVSADWDHFSSSVVTLLKDVSLRCELQARASRYAEANFSPEKVYAPLSEVLASVVYEKGREVPVQ
ncbi:MAG TPA: glycosyltransferase [Desulfuromonadales bacterium]|nr:glycosyltransferase [Desulfuromonadales bacterium]